MTYHCLAEFQYFDSDHHESRKRGSIDLTQCEEVLQKLDSQQYPNIFGLKTKHHGHDRTYYLAADSEEVMNTWVAALCRVLHLDYGCELCLLLVINVDACNIQIIIYTRKARSRVRSDHFSNIVADREFSTGCYLFTVSNSGLLSVTRCVLTTPSQPRPLQSPTTLWF